VRGGAVVFEGGKTGEIGHNIKRKDTNYRRGGGGIRGRSGRKYFRGGRRSRQRRKPRTHWIRKLKTWKALLQREAEDKTLKREKLHAPHQ